MSRTCIASCFAAGIAAEKTLEPVTRLGLSAGEVDGVYLKWMWLYKGETKRCYCGYWYKLVEVPVIDFGQL